MNFFSEHFGTLPQHFWNTLNLPTGNKHGLLNTSNTSFVIFEGIVSLLNEKIEKEVLEVLLVFQPPFLLVKTATLQQH